MGHIADVIAKIAGDSQAARCDELLRPASRFWFGAANSTFRRAADSVAAGGPKTSRKQKRTAKKVYADLVKLGYDSSYDRVAAFARHWRIEQRYEQQTSGRGTFVPLVFQPGERSQVDWSEDYAMLGGKPAKLQAAQTGLAHSRAFIVRVYLLQTAYSDGRRRLDKPIKSFKREFEFFVERKGRIDGRMERGFQ